MKLLIVGAGGHGKVCAEIAELNGYSVSFLDDRYPELTFVEHWKVVGKINDCIKFSESSKLFVAIGCNDTRAKIAKTAKEVGLKIVTLIHPTAQISKYVKIADGVLISASAVINGFSELNFGCIINTAAVIEHDVIIGEFSHISPGAVMLGGSSSGIQSWVGASAVVFPGITVGDYATLGAASMAKSNLVANSVNVGCPAKQIK